ncbi:hypothetical protein ACOI9Y_38030, partial [Mesorhizobium japonicum]
WGGALRDIEKRGRLSPAAEGSMMPIIVDPNGGRSVYEWIGKSPDSVPPPSVRARIFLRGNCICHISQGAIGAGENW